MLSPFLPQALILATDRAEQLRSEADAARLARPARPDGSGGRRPGRLGRLVAGMRPSGWQAATVVPPLRDYPYPAG